MQVGWSGNPILVSLWCIISTIYIISLLTVIGFEHANRMFCCCFNLKQHCHWTPKSKKDIWVNEYSRYGSFFTFVKFHTKCLWNFAKLIKSWAYPSPASSLCLHCNLKVCCKFAHAQSIPDSTIQNICDCFSYLLKHLF